MSNCRSCFFYVREFKSTFSYCGNKNRLDKDEMGFYKLKRLSRNDIDNGCKLYKKNLNVYFFVHNFNYITGKLK